MSIRAVIFDYGEVLCHAPDASNWARLARLADLPEEVLQRHYWQFRDDYDRGALSGAEYWHQVGEAAGQPLTPVAISELITADCEQWSHLNKAMVDFACALPAQGLRTAVLSNMHHDMVAVMERDFDWLSSFQHHTYSCRVGSVKPEPAIYEHCLQGLGTRPGETLFLDDRARNVEAARALGIQAHIFTSFDQLPAILRAGA